MELNNKIYIEKFQKTFELIDLVFKLKQTYIKNKYPDYSQVEIEKKIYNDILKRKAI